MANSASARKRAKQNRVRRQRNISHRSRYRTYVKKVRAALLENNLEAAREAFKVATPIIDSMVNKKIITKNKAARLKSRLSASIKKLAVA